MLLKILQIFLSEIDCKTGSERRKMSYCNNKYVLMCKGFFRKENTYEFIKMTSTFAFMCVDQVNNFTDIKNFTNIIDTYRKNIDYKIT